MIAIRTSQSRGDADHGWLHSKHTFSFADYYDPKHMGFRSLRVINEDRVEPGRGFGTHPHRDMEIISYVLDGGLEHKDSIGTGSVIRPGDVQRMTAGTGVSHSEFNASKTDSVHFLQIWIMPSEKSLKPSYEQKRFEDSDKRGKLRLVASPEAADGSVKVHADARLYAGLFKSGESSTLKLEKGRHAYVHVARGVVKVADRTLGAGDAASISEETEVKVEGAGDVDGEVLVFDLG